MSKDWLSLYFEHAREYVHLDGFEPEIISHLWFVASLERWIPLQDYLRSFVPTDVLARVLRMLELGIIPYRWEGRFRPLTDEQIVQIEALYEGKLPADYLWFLTTYGSFCFDEEFYVSVEGHGGVWCMDFNSSEILETHENALHRLPKYMVPISNDGGDNWLCLSVRRDKTYGRVYFHHHCAGIGEWSNDEEVNEREKFETLLPIAQGFTHLISLFARENDEGNAPSPES